MRLFACLFTAGLSFAIAANEQKPAATPANKTDRVKLAPRVLKPAEAGVGRMIADVEFTDRSGEAGKLSDFRKSKLTIVAFTSTSCPLSKKYVPSLARLEKEYSAKGVAFLFVYPIATDTPDAKAFAGRSVHDLDGKLTAAFAASATAEVFVLDSTRTVLYRGAIDDQYGLGYAREQPRNRYLAVALDEALAGKAPFTSATEAPGCTLEPDPAKALPVTLTYHARIERIVQANCIECHRTDGVAPFSLEKYEDVISHKAIIKTVVQGGTMPPWFAKAQAQHSLFANDRSLTENDKNDLLTWLAGDHKKGDPADAPLPRKYESGWLIGKPDVVFQIPKPIAVKAEGTMPYQDVTVETNLDEDKWVQALEVQPTARQVVHHVLVHAVPKGAALKRNAGVGGIRPDAEEGRDEAQGFFAIYVPGNSVLMYPEGYAKKLPRGSTLRFQIHYTPNGKATEDQTKFGMVFAKEPPRHEVKVAGIVNRQFLIPPGNDNYKVEARIPVPFDARILAFAPHMHLRGKAAKYELKTPEGKTATLLDVPHYDFNWQLLYRLATPIEAPRGSTISFTAWYDNSEGNPANPDPKKYVKWGQQTYDEMHLGYVEYVVD